MRKRVRRLSINVVLMWGEHQLNGLSAINLGLYVICFTASIILRSSTWCGHRGVTVIFQKKSASSAFSSVGVRGVEDGLSSLVAPQRIAGAVLTFQPDKAAEDGSRGPVKDPIEEERHVRVQIGQEARRWRIRFQSSESSGPELLRLKLVEELLGFQDEKPRVAESPSRLAGDRGLI